MGVPGNQIPTFSEEEKKGEMLDLHELHEKYVSYGFGRVKYLYYVHDFPGMLKKDVIPPELKVTPEYKEYLQAILDYLISFLDRVGMNNDNNNMEEVEWVGRDPFLKNMREDWNGEWQDVDSFLEDIEEDFEDEWANWPKSNTQIHKDTGLLEAKVVMLCGLLSETKFVTSQHLFWERTNKDVYA